jgi:hypothetical protein
MVLRSLLLEILLSRLLLTFLCLVVLWSGCVRPVAAGGTPPLLLADDSRLPKVVISWPTREGGEVRLEGVRPYRSPGDKRLLGRNVEVYVALGGTRVDRGLGHPDGAAVRVGLYKREVRRPFFDTIADDAQVTITLENIHMNQPVIPRPVTGLMHLQYMLSDLTSCGLGEDARNLYNTADAADPLLRTVLESSVRPGSLTGGGPGRGTITTSVADDGAVTITWKFPYGLLRHLQDPYQRDTPGGFFEPQHFHVELELVSAASPTLPPDIRGAEPGPESKPDGTD